LTGRPYFPRTNLKYEKNIKMLQTSRLTIFANLLFFSAILLVLAGMADKAFCAQTSYTNTQTPLRSAAANGEDIASVSPGAKLLILSEQDGQLEVELTGWSPEGGEKYLFIAINQRIRVAKLTKKGLARRKVIAEKEDYYESIWQDVRLTGWIAKKDTSEDIAQIWKGAQHLFHQRCTRCHALHRPTEFTANQWPSILKIMTVRAGLSAGKKALIVQYMQTHAKDQKLANEPEDDSDLAAADEDPTKPKITGDAKLAALGGEMFTEHNCNACHGDDAATPAIPAYPKLAGQSADYAFKQMQDFKSRRRANDQYEIMKESIAEVPEADMRAIAWWLSTL